MTNFPNTVARLLATLVLVFTGTTASALSTDVEQLQSRWAEIKYQLPEKEREAAYERLIETAQALSKAQPECAPCLIWEGIIRSSYAGEKGGLGALSQVKEARKLFERAIEIEPGALAGSAYTSLGALYYQVPGWPLGFGDNEKALKLLETGVRYNPDGIDTHYFLGDYFIKQHRYEQALKALNKALAAPARPGRALADKGRRKEVEAAIKVAREKAG